MLPQSSVEVRRAILISDDRPTAERVQSLLERRGWRCSRVEAGQGPKYVALLQPQLVVVDVAAGRPQDVETIARMVDLIGGRGDARLLLLGPSVAPQALIGWLDSGAAAYLGKPLEASDLLERVKALCDAPVALESPVRLARRFGLIGRSEAFQRTLEQIELVADKSANVLICGETGVGKERVARAIHAAAARSAREMVTLNCAGIPATLLEDELFGHEKGAFTDAYQRRVGCFEQAAGSTIFLDEIGELPLELQPKLLRVLQEREIRRVGGAETVRVDARVVVATNVDLWKRVEERRFREDLFYRINVFPIRLPPLRERREDIPLFLDHFLEQACTRERMPGKPLAPGVCEALCRRDWPGNVRQLENAAEMAVIRAQNRPVVDLGDFPPPRKSAASSLTAQAGAAAIDFKSLVEHFERDVIGRALEQTRGNKTMAARALRMKRTTLVEKVKKFERATPAAAAG